VCYKEFVLILNYNNTGGSFMSEESKIKALFWSCFDKFCDWLKDLDKDRDEESKIIAFIRKTTVIALPGFGLIVGFCFLTKLLGGTLANSIRLGIGIPLFSISAIYYGFFIAAILKLYREEKYSSIAGGDIRGQIINDAVDPSYGCELDHGQYVDHSSDDHQF
jgi:hypothetical protein